VMHGREKSDLAIVTGKPANKAGPPAAELVERRAGAEGNVDQHLTNPLIFNCHSTMAEAAMTLADVAYCS